MFILSNSIFVSLHLFSINIKYLSYILHDDHHPMSSLPVPSVPSLFFPSLNLSPFILFPFRCLHLFPSLPFTSFTSLYLSSLLFPFLFPSPFFFFLLFLAFLFPSLPFPSLLNCYKKKKLTFPASPRICESVSSTDAATPPPLALPRFPARVCSAGYATLPQSPF